MGDVILRIALPLPLKRLFDYLPPQDVDLNCLKRGVRVCVPFQSRNLVGILINIEQKTQVVRSKLKKAISILDDEPILSDEIFKLCEWSSQYYHYALGEVLIGALPTLLRKNKAKPEKISHPPIPKNLSETIPHLTNEQAHAVSLIKSSQHKYEVFLLEGVTGSGKTEVYLRIISEVIAANKQVLVMVPEISLTPQTIKRFQTRFSFPIATLHSNLSERKRMDGWLLAQQGKINIVIGTRSSIFTPFARLGLIIVDEEHDASFKQQDRFRYHARDLAIMRAHLNNIPIILGSATPSLESLLNTQRGRYTHLSLQERAGRAELPQLSILPIQKDKMEEGFSETLLKTIRMHLEEDNQVLLFLNRRGFAPVLYCTSCMRIEECTRCDTRMVYHSSPLHLRCHQCEVRRDIPTHCGHCKSLSLQAVGLGTQRLEAKLSKYFPEIPILRIDRDSTARKGSMEKLLDSIQQQNKAILLGTQMLAKGHHFPKVTLVGIIDIDSGLFSADFRAVEQMGQLIIQVAGRAGRAEKKGTVLIQTHHPQNELLLQLIQQGYPAFAHTLLEQRKNAVLPPFSYFALFKAEAYAEEKVKQFLMKIKKIGEEDKNITFSGPFPALIAKRKGLHCQQLLLKAKKRSALQMGVQTLLEKIEKFTSPQSIKWILDVDPIEM